MWIGTPRRTRRRIAYPLARTSSEKVRSVSTSAGLGRRSSSGVGDPADEGVDPVPGDEGRGGGRAPLSSTRRAERDLLLGLAQRGPGQVGVAGVLAPAGERDLAGVAAKVGAALGEDQAGALGPAV